MRDNEWQKPFEGLSGDVPLSEQCRALWAKTGGGEERNLWSPLYVHMGDSACIACILWNEWLSDSVKRQICNSIDSNNEAARALVSWLAGVHDIGKATPGFQYKVSDRAEHVEEMGLRLPSAHMVTHSPSHAYMGEVILENWLDQRGWMKTRAFGSIVGAHHGMPPSGKRVLTDVKDRSENFPIENLGDEEWVPLREELLVWMFEAAGMAECEGHLRSLLLPQPAQVLVSALVIMSDWIASNSDFFPLVSHIEDQGEFIQRAGDAWRALSLPPSWKSVDIDLDSQELFHARFKGLPDSARLRPAQLEALQAVLAMDNPGLLIIEAPMGNGKTEASLLCAEVMAAKSGAGGVAYLLPTMATSNAMFARVEEWLEGVPDARGRSTQSIQLLHGKAALNSDYAKLRTWNGTWMGDDAKSCVAEDIVAHQWFAGRKRGLLSSFVVGTVDQLLMAALKTKHAQLHHLGLAGKVVVIDEVHAYDAYMNTYLDRVLTWLGSYGVPTILLSATLPADRRKELVHAYRGRDKKTSARRSRRSIPEAPREESGRPAYPLVTVANHSGDLGEDMYRMCEDRSTGTDVLVRGMEDDDESLSALLDDLLSDGGCACVLRDTVSRAQATYEQLKQFFGSSCVKLVHSRFIAVDRMSNDAELLRLLGPDPGARPDKLVVVGTQVIEQSLDIDFDVMVTDVAPVDLLLQRMGRLHRHQRGVGQSQRPRKLRQARCFIAGVEDWDEIPPKFAKGVDSVYPRSLLWRSLLALKAGADVSCMTTVNLPHDIATLVELVYSSGDMCEAPAIAAVAQGWEDALHTEDKKLAQGRVASQIRAGDWLLGKPQTGNGSSLIGWLRDSYSSLDDARGRAAVRDTDESIEVIVVQECKQGFELLPWVTDGHGGRPLGGYLGDGSVCPDDEVARLAANCTVSLPPRLSASWVYASVIKALEMQAQIPGWQASRWLQGQLALVLDSSLGAMIETDSYVFRLRYSREAGLELIAAEKKGEDEK